MLGEVKPALGFLGVSQVLVDGGVGAKQRCAVAECRGGIELRNLQFRQRCFSLTEVEARAGHRDGQVHLHVFGQGGAVDRTAEFKSFIRSAEASFTVHHQGELIVFSGNPPVGAKLAQRQCIVPDRVGSDRQRLAHNSDSTGPTRGRLRVLVGECRVVFDMSSRHREVPGGVVGILLAQGLQLRACGLVEIRGLHVFRKNRVKMPVAHGLQPVGIAILPGGIATAALCSRAIGPTTRSVAVRRSTGRGRAVRTRSGRAKGVPGAAIGAAG